MHDVRKGEEKQGPMLEEKKTAKTFKRRIKKAEQYWQGQEANLHAMFQKADYPYLAIHEKAEMVSYFPDLRGKRILDLAAGIGRYTRYFSEQGKELVSVDLVPQFVQKNRADHTDCPNVSFLCSDARDLQFKGGYFDFIFINWLFLYLEDEQIEPLLDRLYEWLAPAGELLFRESCDLTQTKSMKRGYYAHYRPPSFYEAAARRKFTLLKEGYIRTYVDRFADPLQCFWHCQKHNGINKDGALGRPSGPSSAHPKSPLHDENGGGIRARGSRWVGGDPLR